MVKVEDFNRQFSDFKNELPYKLKRYIVDFQLVGSTQHNGEGKDYDVVVLVDYLNFMVNGLASLGWTNESGFIESRYPVSFISMRNGDFNLLLTKDEVFFQSMKNSSEVVRKVQDMFECKLSRRDVCDIYSLILYGHQADE